MSTIVTRSGKGSALSTSEMDSNLTNLNTDKLENIVEDTTPQLGGNLDVQTNSIVSSTVNGNISVTPDGSGKVIVKRLQVSDGSDGNISVDVADGNLNLSAGSGTGVVNINSTTGIQISADGSSNANVFTASSNGNIVLKPNGTGVVISDKNHLLQTGTLVSASGTDLTLSTQGASDLIVMNQTAGVVVTDTAASGKGVITGETSKGIAILSNGGASNVTDPSVSITSGGGATVSAGTGSALALVGGTVGITGTTTVTGNLTVTGETDLDLLTNYVHDIQTVTPSGTYAPDPSTGNVIYVIPQANLTINDFATAAIEPGQSITLFIDQSSYSTSYTLTLGSNFLLPGGTAPTLTATGNDLLTMTCLDDGTTSGGNIYIANFVANYQ